MPKKEESVAIKISRILGNITTLGFSVIKFLALLFIAAIVLSALASTAPELKRGNVAVIPIEGMITSDGQTGFEIGVSSKDIIDLIEKADEKKEIKAILLEIDSPGGTPVATDEIAQAVKRTNKTTVAVIRETGASGAYWIATAADRIFANRMSVTGSIGVQASHLELTGLITDYNITYRRLVAGKYKDLGSRFREMLPDEQQLYQRILDDLHGIFIRTVAENRGLPEEKVRELATGFVYLGSEAQQLGLVDEIGGKTEALKHIENTLNITAEPVEYAKQKTLFDELFGLSANAFYSIGKGGGSTLSSETVISFT